MQIRINKLGPSCPQHLKSLEGCVIEAMRGGPFSTLPPIPNGGSITLQVVFGVIDAEHDTPEKWVIEPLAAFNALMAAGQELAARRFKRSYSLKPIGLRQAIVFPIGHPDFDIAPI